MCGIIGVMHADPESNLAAYECHDALYLLQHRGQDACGITSCGPGGRIYQNKGNGMASKVFKEGATVGDLPGYMALGHLRYPTAGSSANSEAQPFYVNSPYGICFTHNGNLINAPELKRFLDKEAHRHINTDSDSELMLNIFASELNETGKSRVNADDIFAALERTSQRCVGGWACTAMLAGFGLIGFRDPHGIRPIVLGSKPSETVPNTTDYMLASESVALTQCGYKTFVDIRPGQAVILEKGRPPVFHQVAPQLAYAPDIFEYVYFARPDSVIDGIDVDESRRNMGFRLADTIRNQLGEELLADIDVVMPIPETSITSALCVAESLGKPYVQGFVKNRYIFRTFIMPNQKMRQKGVRAKLNPMKKKFEGKNVLLVDDSIVRGTTSREIVLMAREAGAKKVIFTSCAPPITNAHIYGIDLAVPSELIAHSRTPEAIAKHIGADAVIYQNLPDLITACAEAALDPSDPKNPKNFEVGVFCGKYITPVDDQYFVHLERIRSKAASRKAAERARRMVADNAAISNTAESYFDHKHVLEAFESSPVSLVSGLTGMTLLNGNGQTQAGNSTGLNTESAMTAPTTPGALTDAERRVTQSQDISLHNLNDYASP
ncbi:amidophosphoribosyltransferase [Rhizodiscina lignyota]|uniref:amidophosphoribosyltransferase n=1 Tax=Rhizodiscina lignyota TaxID=1504668 RepID=A0A9P4IGV3_9PEZI|nr:amidophosphoribosyltransferase [Rhizodiscina lignyota]